MRSKTFRKKIPVLNRLYGFVHAVLAAIKNQVQISYPLQKKFLADKKIAGADIGCTFSFAQA